MIGQARAAGFDNVNIDLMFALPEQTFDQAMDDLDQGLALGSEHLSWYQLTLEPGTAFARRPPPLPTEDTAVAIWETGQTRLAEAGFAQYEVSAYARPGRQCRHNQTYWHCEEYIGVGAGAHGMVGWQRRERQRYAARAAPAGGEQLLQAVAAHQPPVRAEGGVGAGAAPAATARLASRGSHGPG